MKQKSIEAYVWGSSFVRDAVRKVLIDRKGASTVEYVAVLAGAAALGGAVLAATSGENGAIATLKNKIMEIVNGI